MSENFKPSVNGNYIEISPGVDIYYEEKGQGPVILIVPGWTFTTEVFKFQLDLLSENYRVIVIDPRSQGRSTITIEGNDYITHASDLAKVIDALKLQDIILIGWSFGALTTWGYIKEKGLDNLRCHICVDLSPKPLSVNSRDWIEGPLDEIAEIFPMLRTAKGQREFVASYAEEAMVLRELKPEELTWLVEQSTKSPPWVATLLFTSGVFGNNMAEAKLLDEKKASLFIVAEHWGDTAKMFLSKNFPNSHVEVLGGHMMFWEYPEKFNKILEDFIHE